MTLQKKEMTATNLYELEVAVDKETFEAATVDAYRKNVKKMTVPGFRKGKAPKSIIEKMYGKGVFYEEAVNACIPDAYEAAIKEAALDVVGQPEFDVASIGDEGLVLKIKVYTKPEVKIEGYLGLEAERTDREVTDADVEEEINRVRERNSRTVDVTDRAAAMGDTVNFDYEGSLDGVAFDGGKAEKYNLKLGSGQFIPGFEEQIVGKQIGEEFDVNVTFPEEYHAENLKGKAAVFKCKLHGIKMTELPELDDEFAKDVSEFDTLDAYKADIQAKIGERYKKAADSAFEEALMDVLVTKMEAEIPEVMYEAETENYVRDYDSRLRMQGLDLNTYFKYTGMTLDQLRQQMRPQAERQVKVRLALEAIVAKENLTVAEADVDAEFQRISEAYNVPLDQVKSMIKAEDLEKDLLVKAAADLVKEKAVPVAPKAEEAEAKEEN
ncbi:MAG: trigger factor [Clostridia bacterium]|nr:trigger factor [Clostridia bacterium]